MADEPQTNPSLVLRGINWREVFPFTHIFRAFRIAVHPSKLVLGLVALLVLYCGGRIMDGLWASKHLALVDEAELYEGYARQPGATKTFAEVVARQRESLENDYAKELRDREIVKDETGSKAAAATFERTGDVARNIMYWRDKAVAEAPKKRDDALLAADKIPDEKRKVEEKEKAQKDFDAARPNADRKMREELAALKAGVPHGVFEEFFGYQVRQVNGIAKSVAANNWFDSRPDPRSPLPAADAAKQPAGTPGVLGHLTNLLAVGPVWLWKAHPLYAALFTLLFLAVWAVFGGAISRIAAVQVARDEKISVRQALRFSFNKVLSFAFAPLIPLVIVLVIGLVVAVGGLLFYIPVVGPILGGALMFLALIAGVVITLVLFGTVGGLNLMFPTIAVEGSDSFDAISRSFSYVFARPWRMAFYTLVSIAYFALTYIFVRFFVFVVLCVTHFFVSWFLGGQPGYYFNWIWPAPESIWVLPYDVNFAGLAWSEDWSAFLTLFWNMLFIGLVGAFAISFYLSVNTIIYALMRREVDATELEDVYLEDAEDDLIDSPAAVAVPATGTPVSPVPSSAPAGGPVTAGPATIVGSTLPPTTIVEQSPPFQPPAGDVPPPSSDVPPENRG